jgi:DNA-directed RNA polymerase subunit E'
LKEGDKVRARIVTVSMKRGTRGKIGLTMRQPGLGKLEWIKEEREAKA